MNIPKNVLENMFYYEEGNLFWKNPSSRRLKPGEEAGHLRSDGYKQIKIYGKLYKFHRIVWMYHYGDIGETMVIDHIDNDKSNNKIENLRICSQSQNMGNSIKRKPASSKYKGVHWHSHDHHWRVEIRHNSKRIYVGSFSNEEDAHKAYCRKARELFGDFASDGVNKVTQ